MDGPIARRSEAKDFISSSAYSIECLRRYMELVEKGELIGAAATDITFASKHKYRLVNSTPHYVFNYYTNFFWGREDKIIYTRVTKCGDWVLEHETKESKKNIHVGYFNHLTNKLMAIGFIYRRKERNHYLIFLENVVRIKGIPWFRRRNQRLVDPEFRPEGGIFSIDGIDWSK